MLLASLNIIAGGVFTGVDFLFYFRFVLKETKK